MGAQPAHGVGTAFLESERGGGDRREQFALEGFAVADENERTVHAERDQRFERGEAEALHETRDFRRRVIRQGVFPALRRRIGPTSWH